MSDKKRYLGDGVYVDLDQWDGSMILTTENGIETTNIIVVDAGVWKALLNWVDSLQPHREIKAEPESGAVAIDKISIYELCTEQADCTCYAHLAARLAEAEAANQSLQTQSQKAFDFLYELNEWVVSRKKGIAMAETEKKPMTREEMQNRLDWLEPCLNDGDAGRFFTMEQLVAMDSERKQLRERLAEAAKGQQDGN